MTEHAHAKLMQRMGEELQAATSQVEGGASKGNDGVQLLQSGQLRPAGRQLPLDADEVQIPARQTSYWVSGVAV
jgi:hypothetical protein